MHLDVEQVQRLVHGEAIPQNEASVRKHIAGCAECAARVADAEAEEFALNRLLRSLDHAPPQLSADTIAERARGSHFGWGRWAAGIMLVLGAGAAYAAPGSPLRAWINTAFERVAGAPQPTRPPVVVPAPPPPPDHGGMAVDPGQHLLIVFTATNANEEAIVRLVDTGEVMVRAATGAATFTSDVDRILVETRSTPARFEIAIPRNAPHVEIRVGDRVVLSKSAARITTQTLPREDGSWLVSLRPK